jgi:hypothetical protein
MDSSTLFARLNNLESSWSSYDSWLKFWIALVVVGVAIELVVVVKEYRDDRHEWSRGIIRPPDRPSGWLLFWNLLGAGFVAIGVAGEFAIHLKAGKVETDIRSVTRELVAISEDHASTAELETTRLRAAIADRDLTPRQRDDIRASMRAFAGKEVFIRSYPNDPEAARLIVELKAALDPPLRVADRTGELGATWANAGLILGIRVSPTGPERKLAETLVRSFRDDGKLAVEDLSQLSSDGPTEILVGVKPIALAAEIEKTARLQKEAEARRLALEKDLKAQGPRWRLLRAAKGQLVSALSPFAGQRAGIYVAGPQILVDEETMSTWGALAEAIGGDGAKWKLEHGGLTFADREHRTQGIYVYVSTKAAPRTAQAADALAGELVKILPPFFDKTLLRQDPDWFSMLESRGFPQDKDAAYIRAGRDPDLITIMIGTHPQQ